MPGDLTPGLAVAVIALALALVATAGAERYELSLADRLLTGHIVWWRVTAGIVGTLAIVVAAVMLLATTHASAAAPAADRPDVPAAFPHAVSGLASTAPPTVDAHTFASLSLPSALSGAAAGGEGRQGVSERDLEHGFTRAVPTSAPAGPPSVELPPIADAIAACESGAIDGDGRPVLGTYDLEAENPTSSASGKWQAIDATWTWITDLPPPASAYPEHVQDEFFLTLWDDGRGSSHWSASSWCWAGAS